MDIQRPKYNFLIDELEHFEAALSFALDKNMVLPPEGGIRRVELEDEDALIFETLHIDNENQLVPDPIRAQRSRCGTTGVLLRDFWDITIRKSHEDTDCLFWQVTFGAYGDFGISYLVMEYKQDGLLTVLNTK